jgi:hypothetical protein
LNDDLRGHWQSNARFSFHAIAKILALQKLHCNVGHAVVDSKIENLHDVLTAQTRSNLRFSLEPRTKLRRFNERRHHELDRDVHIEFAMARNPYRTHAAFRQRTDQHVAATHDNPQGRRDHGHLHPRNRSN